METVPNHDEMEGNVTVDELGLIFRECELEFESDAEVDVCVCAGDNDMDGLVYVGACACA